VPKAIWNGAVIAEAPLSDTVSLEGNVYFPEGAVDKSFLKASDKQTTCAWKGTASYYDLEVAGKTNAAAAWYYAEPKSAAANIRGRIAFWKGVEVTSS
jgi:uncharacterized protein (DUF427 family)